MANDDQPNDTWSWLGLNREPDFRKSRALGGFLGFLLVVLIIVLVVYAIGALVHLLLAVFMAGPYATGEVHSAIRNIGLVLAAVFGAPFLAWRSYAAHKQATTADEGLITDRITKAVEGLGSEKTVNRIGRPLTLWTGQPRNIVHLVELDDIDSFELPIRSVEVTRKRKPFEFDDGNVFDGLQVEIKKWPAEITVIEWQGENKKASDTDHIGHVGDWQVFTETEPNIEVRTGALYALERVAQDSPRDHIQIMEIITAYVRENSPFNTSKTLRVRSTLPSTDIRAALTIIGRRTPSQILLERSDKRQSADGYRLDLRNTNLKEVDLSNLNFEFAQLNESDMQGVNLSGALIKKAYLGFTQLQGVDLSEAQMQGVLLIGARMDNSTVMTAADTTGVAVYSIDFGDVSVSARQLKSMFGDTSVILPDEMKPPPDHWPKFKLHKEELLYEWLKWQDDPDSYTPPAPQNPPENV